MKVFTHQFKTKVKQSLYCKWRGCKIPKKWTSIHWTIGHFGGYRKFCSRCGSKVSTFEQEQEYLNSHVVRPAVTTTTPTKLSKKQRKELKKSAKKKGK